jgi:hypothetical protein
LFAAIVAWQLGSLPQETLGRMTLLTWTFAICFVGIAFLSWKYFFLAPFIFSGVITPGSAAGRLAFAKTGRARQLSQKMETASRKQSSAGDRRDYLRG